MGLGNVVNIKKAKSSQADESPVRLWWCGLEDIPNQNLGKFLKGTEKLWNYQLSSHYEDVSSTELVKATQKACIRYLFWPWEWKEIRIGWPK